MAALSTSDEVSVQLDAAENEIRACFQLTLLEANDVLLLLEDGAARLGECLVSNERGMDFK